MLRAKNIWVVGGDPRQAALAALLADDGHCVHSYALEQGSGARCEPSLEGADRADCVVLPLPAAGPDGKLNAPLSAREHELEEVLDALRPGQLVCAGMVGKELEKLAEERGLALRDYFAREELAVMNAIPTAEGAIQIAMEELPITIHDARVLVVGFGRLGRALGPRLRALGAKVWVSARRYEQRAAAEGLGLGSEGMDHLSDWLCGYDLVFNTVPFPVLGVEELPITIHDARVLVVGFGRLGKALGPRLRALGAKVWVSARRYEQRAAAEGMGLGSEGMDHLSDWLCSYDLVFNTAPAPVLGVEELAALKEGALVIDLASRPGGVNLDAAAALGVRVIWALSLPGKVAPVTSGRYIKDTVYHIMEELNR